MSWLKDITLRAKPTASGTKTGTVEIEWCVAGTATIEVEASDGATVEQIAESVKTHVMDGAMREKWDELSYGFVRALKAEWLDADVMAMASLADCTQQLSGVPRDDDGR